MWPAQCKSDADCGGDTPLCDTLTGVCFVGCRENSDCGQGAFCDLDTAISGSCAQKPGRGTCRTLAFETKGGYTRSTVLLNWWSGDNFCRALGKQMIDYDSLNCYKSGTTQRAKADDFYCCRKGMTCDGHSGSSSDELAALAAIAGGSFFTKTLVNSCNAFYAYGAYSIGGQLKNTTASIICH